MPVITGLSEKRKLHLKEKLKELLPKLQKLNPERVILFGSFVRGEVHKGSDLDLIIIAKDVPLRFIDRLDWAYESLDPDFPLDILVYTPEEIEKMKLVNPFIKRALKEGLVIYERGS
ncbi:MAG: nucleotidyltransferase domain-containing protein [Caldimicrobium sp.]